MKIAVIGIGQCGCNIADEFAVMNNQAHSIFGRKIEIVTDIIAVNTDETDLRSAKHIPVNKRILVGTATTHGHGVGKINLDSAQIFGDNHLMLTEEILASPKFYDVDAVVVIAATGGGTGSGGIGHIVKVLKERLMRNVFAIVVLPFSYEENGEVSYALTNSATCLRTVDKYADATFLIDNNRFGRGPSITMSSSFREINQRVVGNFYDLFCAGEEKSSKYVGSKVMDAGDIMNSLVGLSVIGRGEVPLQTFRFLKRNSMDTQMRKAGSVSIALAQAMNNFSVAINLKHAHKILALLCAPKELITQSALQEIHNHLLRSAPKAEIRIGDYPRRGKEISLTVIASELETVAKVDELYNRALITLKRQGKNRVETEKLIRKRKGKAKGIPTLA